MIPSAQFHIKSRNLDCVRNGKTTGESWREITEVTGSRPSTVSARQQVAHPNSSPAATSGLGAEHRAFFIQ